MEELKKGEFVSWESEGKISILLKINDKITKYTLIPRDKNYLIIWARSKEKWSTPEYYEEKIRLDSSKKGIYRLYKEENKQILKLGKEEFILPNGLPKENPNVAVKSKKSSNFKKFKQMKLIE